MERTKERSLFFRKFIGDKKFYMMVLAVAVPIMIQNGITNFVSLLDNIMIGRIGTEQMSGASTTDCSKTLRGLRFPMEDSGLCTRIAGSLSSS